MTTAIKSTIKRQCHYCKKITAYASKIEDIYSIVGELPGLEDRLGDGVQEEVDGRVNLVPGHLGCVQQIFAALNRMENMRHYKQVLS